ASHVQKQRREQNIWRPPSSLLRLRHLPLRSTHRLCTRLRSTRRLLTPQLPPNLCLQGCSLPCTPTIPRRPRPRPRQALERRAWPWPTSPSGGCRNSTATPCSESHPPSRTSPSLPRLPPSTSTAPWTRPVLAHPRDPFPSSPKHLPPLGIQ